MSKENVSASIYLFLLKYYCKLITYQGNLTRDGLRVISFSCARTRYASFFLHYIHISSLLPAALSPPSPPSEGEKFPHLRFSLPKGVLIAFSASLLLYLAAYPPPSPVFCTYVSVHVTLLEAKKFKLLFYRVLASPPKKKRLCIYVCVCVYNTHVF